MIQINRNIYIFDTKPKLASFESVKTNRLIKSAFWIGIKEVLKIYYELFCLNVIFFTFKFQDKN
jgi:hypothetical protein